MIILTTYTSPLSSSAGVMAKNGCGQKLNFWRNGPMFHYQLLTAGGPTRPRCSKEERKTIHAMVNQEIAQEVELQKGSIMTAVERQIVLSQMARGDMKVAKTVVVNDKTETVEHLPDFKERKNAIAEPNKMEGIYQRELTVFEQQTTVIRPKPKNADL